MTFSKNIIVVLLVMVTGQAMAQSGFDVNLQLKNMHFWRGLRVTNSLVTATSVSYKNSGLSITAWGGMSVDGSYKEVSSIISYKKGGFSVTLLDIFNFSGGDAYRYFDFKDDQTNHILDASVAYDFTQHNIPFNISWSTVLFGNDEDTTDCKNRYSTYVRSGVPLTIKEIGVEPFVALGFALCPDSENMLYSSQSDFDVVNLGLVLSKKVEIGSYTLPVAATLGFNPSMNHAAIQLALNIF